MSAVSPMGSWPRYAPGWAPVLRVRRKAPHRLPEPPEWPLGKPDAVLTLPEPVTLRANGRDVFTNLVVPFPGTQARTLRAIQIRASDPQAVRSVLLSFDESGKLQQSDGWRQGIAGMETPEGATSSTAGLIFWSPAVAGAEATSGRKLDSEAGQQSAARRPI